MRPRLHACGTTAGLTALALTFLAGAQLAAQGPDTTDKLPQWEWNAYVGAAHNSPAGTFLGVIPDRDHLFLGLHLTANILRSTRWSVGWAPEIVPVLIVSDTPRSVTFTFPDEDGQPRYVFEGRGPVYGFAVAPLGVEGQFRVAPHWRAYGAGAGGVVWFTRDVPLPGARAFNYTLEYGGGAIWEYGPKSSLRFGYKFHHLSNAYTRRQNPGLDGNVFLVGWQHALGSRP